MKSNKIVLPIPLGILKQMEDYEAKGTLERDIAQLAFDYDVHELYEDTYEVEFPEEYEEREMVSALIVKAYLAGKDIILSKANEIYQQRLAKEKTELPDECKVANSKHCFLSGKCKKCQFTIPQ